ncbi:MAG: Cna B-type domain-containing protein [Coriobacteriales bacterium]|jgi:pilin isopeptide linkage protein
MSFGMHRRPLRGGTRGGEQASPTAARKHDAKRICTNTARIFLAVVFALSMVPAQGFSEPATQGEVSQEQSSAPQDQATESATADTVSSLDDAAAAAQNDEAATANTTVEDATIGESATSEPMDDETAPTPEAEDVPSDQAADQQEDDGDEDANASFLESAGLEAALVEGSAAAGRDAAAEALGELPGVDGQQADEASDQLFTPLGDEAGTLDGQPATAEDVTDDGFALLADDEPEATVPRQLDGSNIEYIEARWITADTEDNGDDGLLYVRSSAGNAQSLKFQVNYALSGEHNYEPGDVVITIPAHIFKKRGSDQYDYGTTKFPFKEDPSMENDFNWKLVDDTYVLTNTRRMSAATTGYFQCEIQGVSPSELVDMEVSAPLDATIEVITHKGNLIALKSGELTAQFDTEAKIDAASKDPVGKTEIVNKAAIPEQLRVEGVDDYLVVQWYAVGSVTANTAFTVSATDTMTGDYDGFILLAEYVQNALGGDPIRRFVAPGEGYTVSADGREVTQDGVPMGDQTHTEILAFYTAYPMNQFDPDKDYVLSNSISMTVEEVDRERSAPDDIVHPSKGTDPKLVTTDSVEATTTWSYTDPKWEDPQGHFNVFKNGNDGKSYLNLTHRSGSSARDTHRGQSDGGGANAGNGWYGSYPSALNDLQDGNDVNLSYTIDSVGFIMPWTYEEVNPGTRSEDNPDEWVIPPARILDNYFRRPITMTTTDTGLSIGRNGEKLTVGEDYEFVSVEFAGEPWVYKGTPKNIRPDGSWVARYAGDGTFEYERDDEVANYPEFFLDIQRDGEWEQWATATYSTTGWQTVDADGNRSGGTVAVPEGTENIRTRVTFANAALDYDIRPLVKLKSTPEMVALIEDAFAAGDNPAMYIYNSTNMTAERADADEVLCSIDKDGYDEVRGYTTKTMASPLKTEEHSDADIDYDARNVTLHYAAEVDEKSLIGDYRAYTQAIADGRLEADTKCIWRDLLPKGMVPDMDSVAVRDQDLVTRAFTIEDYEGTGRTMLVVEAKLKPTPELYSSNGAKYFMDVPRISFDATIGFDELADYYGLNAIQQNSQPIHNVISYESGIDELGSIDGYRGEPDDPTAGNNIATPGAFADDAEREAMTDLNDDRDTPSFLYAGATTRLSILSAARTSLTKDVQVNNDGRWSEGTYEDKRTVYEGGSYTYRLRMAANTGTVSTGLVMYDSLENFYAGDGNDEADIDAPRWQGTFIGVDTSQLEQMGCAPVVYYSTVENLQLADEADPIRVKEMYVDLDESDVWSATPPEDLSTVTAIAIDARKKADGSDFVLNPMESVSALIKMKAPYGDDARKPIADDAHAYNNVFLKCTSLDESTMQPVPDDKGFVRKDYTKVGIEEFSFEVNKKWRDDDDRDALRPESVTLHLYANDEDTGLTLTLPQTDEQTGEQVWSGSFDNIPYTDGEGNKIRYSVEEDPVEGYEQGATYTHDGATITNFHDPERISIAGTKDWSGGSESTMPGYIRVELYANGEKVDEQDVRPNAAGEWQYEFDNLYRYANGEEIAYTVKEVPVTAEAESYMPAVEGYDITNSYHPFGDLVVSKSIYGATGVSADTEFAFTFDLTTGDGAGAKPVTDDLAYEVTDSKGEVVSTGMLTLGKRTVKIKGGQTIRVKEVPEHVHYKVTEAETPGFTQTYVENDEGSITPNKDTKVRFSNRYAANGHTQLKAFKTLENRMLIPYQFRFSLYEKVEWSDSDEYTLVRVASNAIPTEVERRDDGTVASSTAAVSLGRLDYTETDLGTHTFKVVEEAQDKQGYTYSDDVYYIDVDVADNGDGTLAITQSFRDEEGNELEQADVDFTNSYTANGWFTPRAWKDLVGGRPAKDAFTFELLDENGDVVDTATNDGNGEVAWKTMHFTAADIGRTVTYYAREVAGDDEGIEYSDEVWEYRVTVVDEGEGLLSFDQVNRQVKWDEEAGAYVDAGGSSDMPVFTNELKPGSLSVTKNVADASSANPDQVFTFHVRLIGDAVEDGDIAYTVSQAAGDGDAAQPREETATISGGEFEIALHAGEKALFDDIAAGTAYQVWEETADGWALLEQSGASGEVKPADEAKAVFTNQYQPDKTTVQFNGTKLLDGRAAEAGAFSFTIEGSDGAPMPAETTVQTLEGGFIQFAPISFTSEHAGKTYTYTIREVDPNSDSVDYDMHEETVTVEVVQNEDGTLSSTTTYDADGIAFNNKSRPGSLRITKYASPVTDANKDDEFTFKVTLKNPNGLPLGSEDGISWYIDGVDNATPTDENPDEGAGGEPDQGTMEPFASAGAEEALSAADSAVANSAQEPVDDEGNPEDAPPVEDGVEVDAGDAAQAAAPAATEPVSDDEASFTTMADPIEIADGATVVHSGTSGTCIWEIYSDGTLLFSPKSGDEGTLGSYNLSTRPPWIQYPDEITQATTRGTIKLPSISLLTFSGLKKMERVDMSGFDSSNCSNMADMFVNCTSLKELDLSTFPLTSRVTNLNFMFQNCKSLERITFSPDNDLSNALYMERMFANCSSLKELDLSSFNLYHPYTTTGRYSKRFTSRVYSMDWMFANCTSLERLDIRNFCTSDYTSRENVNMGLYYPYSYFGGPGVFGSPQYGGALDTQEGLFNNCTSLREIVLGPHFFFVVRDTNDARHTLYLPTPPDSYTTGKWIRVDGVYGPYTPEELTATGYMSRTNWDPSAMAGTWIWEVDDSKGAVRFDPNGGMTTAEDFSSQSEDASVPMPDGTTTKRPHFALDSWNTEKDGSGTSYAPGSTATGLIHMGERTTLYAQWVDSPIREYQVKHYQQNASLSGFDLVDTETFEADYGTEVTPAVKDYEGFTAPETQTGTVAEDDSLVIEYRYDRHTYNVVFDGNGADSGQMLEPQTLAYGVEAPLKANGYQKTGALFIGWNTKADGSGAFYPDRGSVKNLSTEDGGEVTLYAQWKENPNEVLEPTQGVVYVKCKAGQTIVIPDLPAGTIYSVVEVETPGGWEEVDQYGYPSGTIAANTASTTGVANNYTARGSVQLQAHKSVLGGTPEAGEYSFVLYDYDNYRTLQTKPNAAVDTSDTITNASGEDVPNPWRGTAPVTFDPLSFTQDDIGKTFHYQIYETYDYSNPDPTVTYDSHAEYVNVTVKDGGHGMLAFDIEYDEDGALFVNRKQTSNLQVDKEIEGSPAMGDGEEFIFRIDIVDAQGNPIPGEFPAKKLTDYDASKTRIVHTPNLNDDGIQVAGFTAGDYRNTVSIDGAQMLHVKMRYTIYGIPYTEQGGSASGNRIQVFQGGISDGTAVKDVKAVEGGPYMSGVEDEFDVPGDTVSFRYFLRGPNSYYYINPSNYGYFAEVMPINNEDYAMTFESGDTVKLTARDTVFIDDLPAGATYTVTELPKDGWEQVSAEGDEGTLAANETAKATFTNRFSSSGETSIAARKVLEGAELSARAYTFILKDAEGETIDVAANKADGSVAFAPIAYSSEDIGKTFTYTIAEEAPQGVTADDPVLDHVRYDFTTYEVSVTPTLGGDGSIVCTPVYLKDGEPVDAAVFTNEVEPVEVEGSKTWDDDDDDMGARPESITVRLRADGREVDSKTVTAEDDWAWSFGDLPRFGADGHPIAYTITEDAVEDYSTAYDGFDITNKYEAGKTSVSVTKAWEDDDDAAGKRPESVTVHLLANGEDTGKTLTLKASENWTGSFEMLPETEGGKAIEYTITEDAVEGYGNPVITGSAVEGFVVTNPRLPDGSDEGDLIVVEGSKTWVDANDYDGIRPDTVTVHLLADGVEVDKATVGEAENWTWTFTDLPSMKDGVEIEYTITEDPVEGYTATIDGVNVTNTHTPTEETPDEPTPWDDTNPDNPGDDEQPSKPGTTPSSNTGSNTTPASQGKASGSALAATGDSLPIAPLALALAGAAVLVCATALRRRNR